MEPASPACRPLSCHLKSHTLPRLIHIAACLLVDTVAIAKTVVTPRKVVRLSRGVRGRAQRGVRSRATRQRGWRPPAPPTGGLLHSRYRKSVTDLLLAPMLEFTSRIGQHNTTVPTLW